MHTRDNDPHLVVTEHLGDDCYSAVHIEDGRASEPVEVQITPIEPDDRITHDNERWTSCPASPNTFHQRPAGEERRRGPGCANSAAFVRNYDTINWDDEPDGSTLPN